MNIPHGIPAKDFIHFVNTMTMDEAKRCRILLAEVLLRMEKENPTQSKALMAEKIADEFYSAPPEYRTKGRLSSLIQSAVWGSEYD